MFNPDITYRVGLAHIDDLRGQARSARLTASARDRVREPLSAPERNDLRAPRGAFAARMTRVRSAI